MDAQHRHELKTNELAEGLSHLPEFLKENANTIIGVVLIGIALLTWPIFNRMARQKDRTEQAAITQSIQMLDQDVYKAVKVMNDSPDDAQAQTEALNSLLNNANTLLDKASEIDNPNLAAMALIKGAQAVRTELHLSKAVEPEMLETQIQKAKEAYQKAFDTAGTPTIKAMAQFGLALCSEELGQTEQSAEIYQQIVDNEAYKATVLPKQAQHRLDTLADNAEVFHFAEAPAVIETPIPDIIDPTITATPAEAAVEPAIQAPAETSEVEKATDEMTEPQAE